jgi:tetratricopeptide (TPR) repeat protein
VNGENSNELNPLDRYGADVVWVQLAALADEMYEQARFTEAAVCWQLAFANGLTWTAINIGNALREEGELENAEAWFREAIKHDDVDAFYNLGKVLEALGRPEGEVDLAYQRALAAGDFKGGVELAFRLQAHGFPHEAVDLMDQVRRLTDEPIVEAIWAAWKWSETKDPLLESALRRGAPLFAMARANYGRLLYETDRCEIARSVLEAGVAAHEMECYLPLATLLENFDGDQSGAESLLRRGAELGDAHAEHNLAVLLEEQGRIPEARTAYRRAARMGSELARQEVAAWGNIDPPLGSPS